MKGTIFVLFLLMGLNATAQDISVRFDRNSDIDFTRYSTYYWARQVVSERDEPHYFLNDLVLKADVRDAVRSELDDKGYQFTDVSPDLLINFRLFDKATKLSGFEGYGFEYWDRSEFNLAAAVKEHYVDAGTLIISIIDRREQALVWQGFASGLLQDGELTKDEGKIRDAVKLIFDEYGLTANKYTRR